MQKVILHMLLGIVAALFLQACSSDTDIDTGGIDTNKDMQKVTINFASSVSDKQSASLRSMGIDGDNDDEEYKIKEIDILAFKKTGASYTFEYRSKGSNIQQQKPDVEHSTVTTSLKKGEQKLVFIANASAEITALNIQTGDLLEDVLPKLTVSSTNQWPANNDLIEGLRYIPMYGEIETDITGSTTSLSNIYLTRLLARIDISLREYYVINFELKEAYIFNPKDRGNVVYNSTYWDAINSKVTAATVPATATSLNTPHKYTVVNDKVIQSIYTFEAKGVTNEADRKKATAIVVGGTFYGSEDIMMYYRIDIPSGTQYSGDILRNHLYNIIIQKVEKVGAPSAEEAFNGMYTLEAEVEVWTNQKVQVDLDQQYYLSVNKSKLTTTETTSGAVLIAETNNPEGITVIDNGISITGYVPGATTQILTVTSSGTGYFTLKAGNMEYIVKIE